MTTNRLAINSTNQRRTLVAGLVLSKTPKGEIAKQLGVDPRTITRDIRYLEALWQKELVEDLVKQLALELATINKMEQIAWGRYYATNSWVWFDRILKCQAQRRNLLGLYKAPAGGFDFVPEDAAITVRETTIRELMIRDPRSRELAFELTERLAGNYTFAALESGGNLRGDSDGPGDAGEGA